MTTVPRVVVVGFLVDHGRLARRNAVLRRVTGNEPMINTGGTA
ncbi:hypothetical protein [Modestobacter lacusdianchii]